MLGAIRAGSSKPPETAVQESAFFIHHGVSMDSLHAIGFYVSSGVSLAGALGVALLPLRDQRGVALGVAGIGLAGVFPSPFARLFAPVGPLWFAGGGPLPPGRPPPPHPK